MSGYYINEELIRQSLHTAVYQLKEGTKTSYYWQSGSKILPNRASISKGLMRDVRMKGRALNNTTIGQFKSTFTKKEDSPFKIYKPYCFNTLIFFHEDYPQFIGWGTAGISNENGQIEDTGDLLIFYSEDANWKTLQVLVFMGMGSNPDTLNEAMRYATKLF